MELQPLKIISLAINPYLAIMAVAVLTSSIASLRWQRRMPIPQAGFALTAIGVSAGLTAWGVGFLGMGQGDYGAIGFRYFSMNLLSPIDPNKYGAVFLRELHRFTDGQYEGYAYFGAGFIALCIAVAPALAQSAVKPDIRIANITPLIVCCAIFTLFALSTRITAGGWLLADIDPKESLTHYFSVLRSSGRMFWVPFYVIWIFVFYFAFLVWRRNIAIAVVAVAFLLQCVDLGPLRRAVRQFATASPASTLVSPVWQNLGQSYKHLVVLPAKQCAEDGPGGPEGFRDFGLLAVSQRMTINSYHAGRYDTASLRYHCDQAIDSIVKNGLASNTAYVVNPQIALLISASPAGPDKCGQIDSYILCANRPLAIPHYRASTPVFDSSGRIDVKNSAAVSKYLLRGWYAVEPNLVWSRGNGVIGFRLPQDGASPKQVRLNVLALVGQNGLEYRIDYGKEVITGNLPPSAPARLQSFSIMVPLRFSLLQDHTLHLIVTNPLSPAALHLNADSRPLGLGLQSMELLN